MEATIYFQNIENYWRNHIPVYYHNNIFITLNTLAYDKDIMNNATRRALDANPYAVYLRDQANDYAKCCWMMMQYWFNWHSYWVRVADIYSDEE